MLKTMSRIIQFLLGFIMTASGITVIAVGGQAPVSYPQADAKAFMTAFADTGYFFYFLALVYILVGLALLFNRYAALALIILAPISVNMVLFHLVMAPAITEGMGAYLILLLNVFLLVRYLPSYQSLLQSKAV